MPKTTKKRGRPKKADELKNVKDLNDYFSQSDSEQLSGAKEMWKMFPAVLLGSSIVVILVMLFFTVAGNWLPQQEVLTPYDGVSINDASKSLTEKLKEQSEIKKFKNTEELTLFLEENINNSYGGSFGFGNSSMMMEEMAFDQAESSIAAPRAMKATSGEAGFDGGGSDDFSETNVQVEGVDEADIIKTDGEFIYVVSQKDLYIVKAYPSEKAEVLSKIAFDSYPQNIFIHENRLVVFGRDDSFYERAEKMRWRYGNFTFFKVFDVTDRKNPKQIKDLDFEGNYHNSRMIGDWIYFVVNHYPNNNWIEPLPRIMEDETFVDLEKTIAPDIYYFPYPYRNPHFVSINAINIKDVDKKLNTEMYLMESNGAMYVSPENMYLTYTKYINEYELELVALQEIIYPRLDSKMKKRIDDILAVSNSILSPGEKKQKIGVIVERYAYTLDREEQEKLEKELANKVKETYEDISKELEKTIIHKVSIDKGELEYVSKGEVTGQVLNQFSMDENDGYFRIATTKNQTWSRFEDERRESYNNLYILDKNLNQVGAVEDLAKGERIYSVRFMQNRAYMVTFKQVDPLFVIDVENPKDPKVLGELKIPGFSNYLHPYDENFLIGFGKDTYETEFGAVRTKGLKLSLFDVRDVAAPKEVDVLILGDEGSYSEALNDHKAFLFSKEKGFLAVPVTIREKVGDSSWGEVTFRGAVVIDVDENGFDKRGQIAHEGEEDIFFGIPEPFETEEGISILPRKPFPVTRDAVVKRALYIDDTLYTMSDKMLKMNLLESLEEVGVIELIKEKEEDKEDFEIVN